MKYAKWKQICSLLACFLIMLAAAINKDQRVLGTEVSQSETEEVAPIKQANTDGTVVVNTTELAKDIIGYGGSIPLEIHIKDGVIAEIVVLKNSETPGFFEKVEKSIPPQWIGLSVEDALNLNVDAISGATMSSNAMIGSLKRGLEHAQELTVTGGSKTPVLDVNLKFICTILIILAGGILPLFIRSPRYRFIQLVLNVIILGFWSGTFISYSLMVNYLSNGMTLYMIIPVLLLIVAFIFPLFGKKNHYCLWVCPLGSLQELAGKSVKYKYKINSKTLKFLNYFRDGLWAVLMLLMWAGVWFEWMDYELFTAFLFQQASLVVIILTIVFILLSFVVQRPYCRFVCPTGNLFRISQNTK